MKTRMLKPLAAVFAAGLLYSCASSNDSMNTTASDETTTMSETQTMAGDDATEETEETEVTAQTDADADTETDAGVETSTLPILEAAATRSDISTFMSLLKAANVTAAFQQEGEYTIFAPTNEAFEALPAGQLEHLKKPENRNELIKLLQAHVIADKVTTAQLQPNQRIQVSDNDFIEVGTTGVGSAPTDFTIGGANIVEANVEAANGVIHIVDKVLVTADRVNDQD